jgi:hypothetical protein
MLDAYDDNASVLVAVVTRPKDLLLAREQGWYRIPVAHAPNPLAADLLALYLTAAFGAERWAVRELAAIEGYSLALRRDLLADELAHPRADERYYRLRLGPFVRLPRPLESRRLRRLTFLNTTLGQLRHARDVVELWQAPCARPHEVWGAGIGATRRR